MILLVYKVHACTHALGFPAEHPRGQAAPSSFPSPAEVQGDIVTGNAPASGIGSEPKGFDCQLLGNPTRPAQLYDPSPLFSFLCSLPSWSPFLPASCRRDLFWSRTNYF